MRSSLRSKLQLLTLILLLPIMAMLCFAAQDAAKSFEKRQKETINDLISPYIATIDASLGSIRRYVASMDASLMDAIVDRDVSNEFAALRRKQAVSQELTNSLARYPDISGIFLVNGAHSSFVQNSSATYAEGMQVTEYLCEDLAQLQSEELFALGWRHFALDGRSYLYAGINAGAGYAGCWVSIETLLEPIFDVGMEGLEDLWLVDLEGAQPVPAQEPSPEIFISRQILKDAPFEIDAGWRREVVFSSVYRLRKRIRLAIVFAVLLFLGYMLLLRKLLVKPMNRLIHNIDNIQTADVPILAAKGEDTEFQKIYAAINDLRERIHHLHIKEYEDELDRQRLKLQMYQLQLRPHFFMNTLNSMVSFARMNDMEMVQRMAVHLATHCRYILYSPAFVTLEEELVYTQNYIDMRSIQLGSQCRYDVQVDDALLDYEIPILSIQIFVENSLKYHSATNRNITIAVRIEQQVRGDQDFLFICIEDGGYGFSAEQLNKLNDGSPPQIRREDGGIGINNVRTRLELLYGGRAELHFSNREAGGARVTILLPEQRKGQEDGGR